MRKIVGSLMYNLRCILFGELVADIGGIKIICGKRNCTVGIKLWRGKQYEPNLLALLRKHLKAGDHFVDVGANIGYITCIAANIVGRDGWVTAFEPHPVTYGILRRNVDINGFDVSSYKAALDSETKLKSFLMCKKWPVLSRLTSDDGGNTIVSCYRGDDLILKADFIKIDVEGAEYDVLLGMNKLLCDDVKLLVEANESHLKRFGRSLDDLRNLIESYGFVIEEINDGIINWYCEKR